MAEHSFHPKIQVSIAGDEMFFGPGPYRLLKITDQTGSVRDACNEMGLSYSKAWKILNRMELEMGRAMVVRSRGGTTGGHTVLTDFGKKYLDVYEKYNNAVQDFAKKEMERLFTDLLDGKEGGKLD